MDDILERIDMLSDEGAMEAVNLLAGEILGATPDEDVLDGLASALGVPDADVSQAISDASPGQVTSLARITLRTYAASGESAAVTHALDATGEKAFLLEIGLIGLLALGLVHTLITRGVKQKERETEVSVSPDGTVTMTIQEKTENYSVGGALGSFAGKLLSIGGPTQS